jgi:hypothetical protein
MGRATTVPLTAPVGVPEQMGVVFVDVSVEVSVSVSFEFAEDGVSETDGINDMDNNSSGTPLSSVGAVASSEMPSTSSSYDVIDQLCDQCTTE